MHLLKVAFLVLLTLAFMRLCSWAVGWALFKLSPLTRTRAFVVANLLCFVTFVAYLYLSLERGEPIDPMAIVFGAIVYLTCSTIDVYRGRKYLAS
jgi:hypothetical protein